jgi:ABC-2 type transport system permease protein
MRNIRLLLVGGLLSYRALFAWLRPSLFIPTMLVTPLLQILFFALLGKYGHTGSDSFYITGNAILACAIPCIYGPLLALSEERAGATLPALLASPGNRLAIFLGRMFPFACNGFLISVVSLTLGSVILGSTTALVRLPEMMLVLIVAALSCTGLGLVLGAVGMVIQDAPFLSNLIAIFMLLVTGANVAVSELPATLRILGQLLPLSHAIAAIRDAAGGAGVGAISGLLGREIFVGVVYTVMSVALIAWIERAARRAGTLSLR